MKLQVGDKVRFLNEAIEGIVNRMLSNNRVEVATADGFSLAAFENQLVKVEFEIGPENIVPSVIPAAREEKSTTPDEVVTQPGKINKSVAESSILRNMETDETVYAAVVLYDELSPLTSDVEVHLLNNSSYSFVFTWNKKIEDGLELVTADVLPARSEKSIGMFSQDELHACDGFLIRMIFFKSGNYQARPPFEKVLRIESNQFLDSNYWEKAASSGNRILLMPLKQISVDQEIALDKLLVKFAPTPMTIEKKDKGYSRPEKSKSSAKYVILTKEKVVDLHIEELLKDVSGMNNAQIISYQINYFLNEMDQAILNKMHKITFIHGVGQGVLKSAIREELKKFDRITFGEGPPDKFGYGATEVLFNG